jgi:hypothetical protein
MNNQRGRFGYKVERYLQVDEGFKPQVAANDRLENEIQELKVLFNKRAKQLNAAVKKVAQR